ncbi:MAG: hypothetical protein Kow0047_15400 [Anaerolineae bacterium]
MAEPWWACGTQDEEQLRELLGRDRVYNAYALGDLEPALMAHCRWFVAGRGRKPEALLLLFERLDPPVLFCYGDPAGLRVIVDGLCWPSTVYFSGLESHMEALAPRLEFSDVTPMWRMAVSAEAFTPVPAEGVQRLQPRDIDPLRRLYAAGEADGTAPDAFSPYQLEEGMFFGVWEAGELVAAAGTHLVSPRERIAAVGNIFVHPRCRRRGLGAAVTSAVTAALLEQGYDVVLNVARRNGAAVRLYEHLGYRRHCAYLEAIAVPAPVPQRT